ncbi:hypothetical protein AAG906_009480 [Vitis piasezkii]
MESPPSAPQPPKVSAVRRYKLVWRLLLAANLALGAYMFVRATKKDADMDNGEATMESLKVREPIPADQQLELFKWILEEKRKVKPKDLEEKKRIDEEKAGQTAFFWCSNSTPLDGDSKLLSDINVAAFSPMVTQVNLPFTTGKKVHHGVSHFSEIVRAQTINPAISGKISRTQNLSNHIHTLPSSSLQFSLCKPRLCWVSLHSLPPINITSFVTGSLSWINIYFKALSPMPGTIQVSVLDFTGLPSSSPSSISIKVSMGKREYQTWDKGDFSFPLTTLRQNLTVTLQDAEGNEISHAEIDTMLVVQKGLLDDTFPLKGGGHVHMKLQFILSEEERNRIRIMRESALKKKHSGLSGTASLSSLSINKKVSDSQRGLLHTETESIREIASQAGLEQNPVNLNGEPQSGADKIEGTQLDDSSTTLNDTDRSGESLSTAEVSQEAGAHHLTELKHTDLDEKFEAQSPFSDFPVKPIFSDGTSSMSGCLESVTTDSNSASPRLEENHADNTEKQSSLRKTPSNVRKMISAFENSLTQEMGHRVAPPVTKSQSTKSWREVLLRGPQKLKETETWNPKVTQSTSEEARDFVLMGEFQQTAAYIRKREEQIDSDRAMDKSKAPLYAGQSKELSAKHIQSKNETPSDKNRQVHKKEERKSFENLIKKFPVETATASGGIFNRQGRLQPSNLVTDERDSGGTSVIEKDGVGVQSRFSSEIISQGGTENTPKPVLYCKAENFSFESCGSCIFLDDTRRLCITTSDKQVMNAMGGSPTEVDIHQRKLKVHGSSDIEGKQAQKTSHRVKKRLESSADVEPSRGPVARAIKVAIMAGFGTFVFLTRQRSSR